MPLDITEINDPRLVKALAHPLRIEILRILEDRTASPKDLAVAVGVPVTNISYHVRALADMGLIELEELTHVRGAVQHIYRSAGKVQITDQAWGEVPETVKSQIAADSLAAIIAAAREAALNGGFDRADVALCRFTMAVDEEGFAELSGAANRFVEEVTAIRDRAAERVERAAPGAVEPIRTTAALLLFESGDADAAAP